MAYFIHAINLAGTHVFQGLTSLAEGFADARESSSYNGHPVGVVTLFEDGRFFDLIQFGLAQESFVLAGPVVVTVSNKIGGLGDVFECIVT